MAHYPDPAPGTRPVSDPELQSVRQINAWTPPTPRWQDAPARARITRYVQAQQRATPTVIQRVRQRIDLVGWILGQSGDGLISMFEDPSDPRVILYNRISRLAYAHNGPHGVLLRHVAVGI
jgi:hypothetical protein